MLMPWTTVYAETHLTNKGWVAATIPMQDFFPREVKSLDFLRERGIAIEARFTKHHRYAVWRDWFPFVEKPVYKQTITLFSNKQFTYRSDDGLHYLIKSISIDLSEIEVEQLEKVHYSQLPINLVMRLMRSVIVGSIGTA